MWKKNPKKMKIQKNENQKMWKVKIKKIKIKKMWKNENPKKMVMKKCEKLKLKINTKKNEKLFITLKVTFPKIVKKLESQNNCRFGKPNDWTCNCYVSHYSKNIKVQ